MISTRRVYAAATALLLAGGVGLSAAAPAAATPDAARRCDYWNGGRICVYVEGNKDRVPRWGGYWQSAYLTNWRIELRSYNRAGRLVYRVSTRTVNHSWRQGEIKNTPRGGRLQYGKACAVVFADGKLLGESCVGITP